ncbi:unnamed protein product [Mytilus coruscus]|uniref:Reverse transcriptase RNase H-like domain-containing protein n=1 Tax=Mytilus coruscus TaxID=42192 RepID=A0A6J8E1F1_MYTCO|nr:unnamed protein product [Mytilus coruscus]
MDLVSRHQDVFGEMERLLASAKTLAYYNSSAETHVIVDASFVGLGPILSQKQSDGNFRPVTFASRTLTDVEQRYSQTGREALAVVWVCERFHLYLYGKEFILVTDHKPLDIIYFPKSKPPACIERWAMLLQPYTFKGSQIVIPDKLRKQTLQLAHEGHQGIVKTKLRLRGKVWWPGIDQDAENLVKSCKACQVVGPMPKQEPIKRTQLPDGPWQDLSNAENRDWRKEIPKFLLAYRSTQHSTTGKIPQNFYSIGKCTKLPEVDTEKGKDDPDTRRKDSEMKEKGKIYADQKKKTRESDIDIGDIVLQKQTKLTNCPQPSNTIRIMLLREKDHDLPKRTMKGIFPKGTVHLLKSVTDK